eukprot:COSAG06_NODE_21594_length_751_cov_2.593558_1_plen_178_part_10
MNELAPRGHLRPLGGRENPRRALGDKNLQRLPIDLHFKWAPNRVTRYSTAEYGNVFLPTTTDGLWIPWYAVWDQTNTFLSGSVPSGYTFNALASQRPESRSPRRCAYAWGAPYSPRAAPAVLTKGQSTGTRARALSRSCTCPKALTETHPGVQNWLTATRICITALATAGEMFRSGTD